MEVAAEVTQDWMSDLVVAAGGFFSFALSFENVGFFDSLSSWMAATTSRLSRKQES